MTDLYCVEHAIRLGAASEDGLAGALRTAWKLRVEKNAKASGKKAQASSTRAQRHQWV